MADKKEEKTIICVPTNPKQNGGFCTFSNTFYTKDLPPEGVTVTIVLKFNREYKVGGKDENGSAIPEWVYRYWSSSEYNPDRKKSRAEEKMSEDLITDDGTLKLETTVS